MNKVFIDGQNLFLGTQQTEKSWKVDFEKFRTYLREKYNVTEAYYFLGFSNDELKNLYGNLRKSGFFIIFREHDQKLKASKKGNVDADIVFRMMREHIESPLDTKFILVSGDGDYKRVIDYLIRKKRFHKLLFPNKKYASSLYKKLGSEYYDYLINVKKYIEYK